LEDSAPKARLLCEFASGQLSPARRRYRPARRDRTDKDQPQDADGDAIGAASLAAGLGVSVATGLDVSVAAGLASTEASGAGVSSDLVQAVAAKTVESRARIRNFRITTSIIIRAALAERPAFKSALEYCSSWTLTS
jgi:hypothetical protein